MYLGYLTRSGLWQKFVEVNFFGLEHGLPRLLELHIRFLLSNPKGSYENEKCGTFLHPKKHDRAFPSIEDETFCHAHAKFPPLKSQKTLRPSHLWRKGTLSWAHPNFEAYLRPWATTLEATTLKWGEVL